MISEAYAAMVTENERLQRDLDRLQWEYSELLLEIDALKTYINQLEERAGQ